MKNILPFFLGTLICVLVACLLLFIYDNTGARIKKEEQQPETTKITTEPTIIKYHIRVTPYKDAWCIHFTSDDWVTFKEIKEVIHYQFKEEEKPTVIFQVALFETKEEAIEFAKQFKTLKRAEDYNDLMQKRYTKISKEVERTYKPPKPIDIY